MSSEREALLAWAFPDVEPGVLPAGGRITVQLRRVKKKSAGGIILAQETREGEKWNSMVAKVISHGPLAYRNRETREYWPEGPWCNVGDYVRVPKWGGDRWEIDVPGDDEPALFMTLNDHEVISVVICDPLLMKAII